MNTILKLACTLCAVAILFPSVSAADDEASSNSTAASQDVLSDELPWDYDPYRVMIWIAGVSETDLASHLGTDLKAFLDRDFKSIWRTDVMAASPDLATIARRDFSELDYSSLTANDLVLVIKRDHENAARIRFAADIPEKLGSILTAGDAVENVESLLQSSQNEHTRKLTSLMEVTEGSVLDLQSKWPEADTEAMFVPRGIAANLKPQPKLVELDIPGRFGELFKDYDKVFLVLVDTSTGSTTISAREIDSLMRWPGPIIKEEVFHEDQLAPSIGRCITRGFAPMVRLDEIGSKAVQGRLRAGNLIMNEDSPANIKPGEFLQPMLRKDDRLGEPDFAGIVEWTFLRTTEKNGPKLTMDIQSGIAGALAGRRNSRTHRMALKLRPVHNNTVLRLHAKGDTLAPLAGYDVFQRDIDTGEFTFIGQTDWDGRLAIEKTEIPMRLLYVKNGSFVLAKLPLVPGQTKMAVADLVGDDIRLQAEAYIRGVQNAIVDLVAIRKLLAANVRRYIKNGDLKRAEELLEDLRNQPSYDKLANDMELKKTQIVSKNRTEQAKIDKLFAETRKLLIEHINPVFLREIETELNAAKGMPSASPSGNEGSEETAQ